MTAAKEARLAFLLDTLAETLLAEEDTLDRLPLLVTVVSVAPADNVAAALADSSSSALNLVPATGATKSTSPCLSLRPATVAERVSLSSSAGLPPRSVRLTTKSSSSANSWRMAFRNVEPLSLDLI